MTDLIVLAFQTDMTRVATQCLGGEAGPNYDDYKVWAKKAGAQQRGTHDVHHKGGGTVVRTIQCYRLSYRDESMRLYGRFMDKLKEIRASDGTLLDHTAILFGAPRRPVTLDRASPPFSLAARPWAQTWPARQVAEGQEAHVRPVPHHSAATWLPGELLQGKCGTNR